MSAIGFDLDHLVGEHALNAWLSWTATGALVAVAVGQAALGDLAGAALSGAVALLAGVAGPFHRSFAVTLPWEVVAIGVAACTWNAIAPGPVALYVTVSVASLFAVLDLHLFTSARMSHRVAAGLVVVGTAATAGAWVALRWAAAVGLGGPPLPTQAAIMGELVVATLAGLAVGFGFEVYVIGWEARLDRLTPILEGEP